jgi:hypothetical protein
MSAYTRYRVLLAVASVVALLTGCASHQKRMPVTAPSAAGIERATAIARSAVEDLRVRLRAAPPEIRADLERSADVAKAAVETLTVEFAAYRTESEKQTLRLNEVIVERDKADQRRSDQAGRYIRLKLLAMTLVGWWVWNATRGFIVAGPYGIAATAICTALAAGAVWLLL